MKANRKSIQRDDEAVSPVIAVILMVAITVVLAATVYVWVSGFSGKNSQASGSIAFSKSISGNIATLTVSSVSAGLQWNELKFLTDATTYELVTSDGDSARTSALTPTVSTDVIRAGDQVFLMNAAAAAGTFTFKTVDTNSNNVLGELKGINLGAASSPASVTVSFTRLVGTANAYAASDEILMRFSSPFEASTVAIGDFALSGATSWGAGATLTLLSPTTVKITLGTGPTVTGATTVSMAGGNVEDALSVAWPAIAATSLGSV